MKTMIFFSNRILSREFYFSFLLDKKKISLKKNKVFTSRIVMIYYLITK